MLLYIACTTCTNLVLRVLKARASDERCLAGFSKSPLLRHISETTIAKSLPNSDWMMDSIISVAAAPPPQLHRSSSISKRFGDGDRSGKRSTKPGWFSQCKVKVRPSSRPARASVAAPVQMPPTLPPKRACFLMAATLASLAASTP